MFFSKNNPASETDSKTAPIVTPPTDLRPVYIIGSDPLACFLGARLISVGYNVILLAGQSANIDLNTNNITIKEDHSLEKNKYKFNTSFWIKEEPQLVIITTPREKMKSAVTAISPHKINHTPVVCFTPLEDDGYIRAFLGAPLVKAYFHGWLTSKDKQISLLGRSPEITVASDPDIPDITLTEVVKLFNHARIPATLAANSSAAFWDYFSVNSAGALLTAYFDDALFNILKNKENRTIVNDACAEIASAATAENAPLNAETIIKKLHNIPSGYEFSLRSQINNHHPGNLDSLCTILNTPLRRHNLKAARLTAIMKKLYNLALAIR